LVGISDWSLSAGSGSVPNRRVHAPDTHVGAGCDRLIQMLIAGGQRDVIFFTKNPAG
jgi:hypothetical protein